MTPVAIGIDLVEVRRVVRLLERKGERAWHRLLTAQERDYCHAQAVPARHVAVRLAAKEAAYKALADGTDMGVIGWRDVEVVRQADGRPTLVLHGRARTTASRLGVTSFLVSLTHTASQAAAVVVLFRSSSSHPTHHAR